MQLYTIPERVLIRGWGERDAARQAKFRLRNGGGEAIGPVALAPPSTGLFEVAGPRRIALLEPGESCVFTATFRGSSTRTPNVQDACVFSVGGAPRCFVRLQATRERERGGGEPDFHPADREILPPELLSPPAGGTAVGAPPAGGGAPAPERPRSGRASRAVTEAIRARTGGAVMLHPERKDLFYMEGVWYDSRGVEWDPNATAKPASPARAPPELPEPEPEPEPEQKPEPLRSPRPPRAAEVGMGGAPPPDWIMRMLDVPAKSSGASSGLPKSMDMSANGLLVGGGGGGGGDDDVQAGGHASSSRGTPMGEPMAGIVAPVQARSVNGRDPDEDEDEDDLFGRLQNELASGQSGGGGRARAEPARRWKVVESAPSRDGDDDDEIYMAQQLANQPAAATGARRKKPTAAQRRAQDAKWDSIA